MEMAVYQIYMDCSACEGKNALSLWLKDASVKFDDPEVEYLDEENICAEMTIQLTLDSGEWYRYIIPALKKEWYNYTIAFSEFKLENATSLYGEPNELASEHIMHMAFGFKYLYYDEDGNHHPTYAIANPVYIDEIYLVNASESSVVELPGIIKPDADNPNKITIETMEDYQDTEDMFDKWSYATALDYNSMTLSDEVSSIGGDHSNKMHYKGATSVSYSRTTQFARSVTAKGFGIDIKGDGKATVYLNLNWRNGSSLLKMRYEIKNAANVWTHYEIGFNNFKDIAGSNKTITQNYTRYIEYISFGIVNSDGTESDIYVDNICLLKNVAYSTKTSQAIDQEVKFYEVC